MDDRTQQLDLTAPIQTGNTKAAAASAGATSADLWMTPYEALRYDPRDNVRPVDPQWVKELTALMMQNGYDKGSPLHCYARKVDGKDYFYVFKGQHRYLAAGAAIKAGKDLGRIPIVVLDSREVKRPKMVIDGYLSNVSKTSTPLDLATSIAELRDVHKMDVKAICGHLNISEQSIRDAALLETAPAELHALIRAGSIAGTLAIEEIRAHGGDKALERIVSGLSKAKEAGKGKVTKKHLASNTKPSEPAAPKAIKITDACAKQLLQALQAVLHDPVFGKLSPGTIRAVHTALSPLTDLLDTPQKARIYPVTAPDQDGRCVATDTLRSPNSKRTKKPIAEIYVAQPKADQWICAAMYNFGDSFASTPLKFGAGTTTYPTRMQAAQEGARWLKKVLGHENIKRQKDLPIVLQWLDDILQSPDPDWTPDMAQEAAK
ncbi:pyridoxal phosphate biosynthetic protein PdxJ [Burkholderia cepacia]|uniref:pyridoxal phosphate biosynthetic protein PdxJ n=1 Tax=Burkholderia cepacia TaxID=292 RepID=UPI002018606D|nr:pyridoxal phosphate biosynthetic protein PdxJ [Burkholderia cepacia]UQO35480.1 pyridoxal phosphate biosynthetic protein PdxJ [Burkholderia cepacia]UQO45792.1 pyridoxal phosphate biosynthetic protein PdxJ [Burkholderia cepacia]UQP10876.1 pyridoxal phosphate biosynthetic protein PdxJ [Burkholderia cepacia]